MIYVPFRPEDRMFPLVHVKALCPDLFSAFGFYELNRNTRAFVGSTDTAFDDIANAQFTAHMTDVLRTIAVSKAR